MLQLDSTSYNRDSSVPVNARGLRQISLDRK